MPVIAPRWLRLRIGPYIRRERDKRFYWRLFRAGRQIGGLRRLKLLATADRLSAESELPETAFRPTNNTVVIFTNAFAGNERKHFHEIVGKSAIVREALIDMTRLRFLPPPPRKPHIAIHVRGGDFTLPAHRDDQGGPSQREAAYCLVRGDAYRAAPAARKRSAYDRLLRLSGRRVT
ncbi:MAG: hypothetical protein M3Z96_11130 [Pseudomonadota bacterium]|nr:hypothetical protein [Pseudomonadota bacterium]